MTSHKVPISADINHVIDELRKRKKKWETKKKQLKMLLYSFITACFISIYYFLQTLTQQELNQPLELFSAFLNQRLAVFIILTLIALKLYLNYLTKEEKEAEKKYESLRIETIEYIQASPNWLINKDSTKRDRLSEELEREGINLRYKAK